MPSRLLHVPPLLVVLACGGVELRGRAVPSPDGRAWLVVDDDNGGGCGPILVDGRPWSHPLHVAGAVEPGRHTIACGGEIAFDVAPGTTFHFDYWGP